MGILRLLFILLFFAWGYMLIMLVCSFPPKKRPSKKSFKEELEEYSKKRNK
jgi:hypothetical protein